jgi:DNA repair photolyase
LPLLAELAAEGLFSAALSIPTLDERAWRATEPHTPHPAARLEAVEQLTHAGVPTSVLVAPLMPGINDDPSQVREIVERARAAGARNVTPVALHLRPGVREVFMEWLERSHADLVDDYAALYAGGSYLPAADRARLHTLVRPERRERGGGSRFERPPRPQPRGERAAQHSHVQATLF